MSLSVIELSCESCGAKLVVEPTHRTARCPYCDSPSVVDRPATTDRPDPVFTIGFAIDRVRARGLLRSYLRGRRWAPQALRQATAERVEGVYLPAYLYSAVADSRYRADTSQPSTLPATGSGTSTPQPSFKDSKPDASRSRPGCSHTATKIDCSARCSQVRMRTVSWARRPTQRRGSR